MSKCESEKAKPALKVYSKILAVLRKISNLNLVKFKRSFKLKCGMIGSQKDNKISYLLRKQLIYTIWKIKKKVCKTIRIKYKVLKAICKKIKTIKIFKMVKVSTK